MDFTNKINTIKRHDLNCNVFDVYSYDGLSMQELLCQFFTKINECIDTSNKTIDLAQWLVNEGLRQEVVNKLMLWLNDGTISNLINTTIFNELNNKIDNSDTPTYNLNVITKEMGVTEGIQHVLNVVGERGNGRILLDKTYEIDVPLVIERTNENTNLSIEIYGGGCIKKSSKFNGDQLLLLKIGYHDEDNIIFNNISFDGVDRTTNGVDTFQDLKYNEECSSKSQHNESKFVKFNDCSFVNCYHGVRLSSLSWVFNGCLFEFNNYGVYLDCSANANTFSGCSIRRNIIGVKVKQFDITIGTIANGFYNCTIESNNNLGFISKLSRNTKLIGNYFENNGYNINTNFEHSSSRRVHILLQDSGGAGQHTIDNFYNVSDFDIVGHFLNSTIINPCKVEMQLGNNSTFISNTISNITFVGFGEYTSNFTIDGVKYKSTKDKILYKDNEIISSNITSQNKNYYLDNVSSITSNSIELCKLTINDITDGIFDVSSLLTGRTSTGNFVSKGAIKGSLLITKSTNGTNTYTAHVDDLKLINCHGGQSGSGYSTLKLFKDNSSIVPISNGNIITLRIDGVSTEAMANWGSASTVRKITNIECKYINTSIKDYNHNFISIT